MELDHTARTGLSYRDAVVAVVAAATAHGFKVQFVHDVAETLAEKGFAREPVTIIEICNAKYASQALEADILVGLMLPCPVMVYEIDGQVRISAMRPSLIATFFPDAGLEAVAAEVDEKIRSIVDTAAAG